MIQKSPKEEVDPNVLHVENIGPVKELNIPTTPGTIVVLEAPNGAGKSTVIDAVGAIANRRSANLTSRDGTVGGFVEGFGVKITVGRNGANRRSGDSVVIGIEDKLNIADFVSPPVKDPAAADLRRTKALVQLTQTSPTLEQYYELVGGREHFDRLVADKSFESSDPVGTAERIKRALESAARVAQTSAETAHSSVVAKQKENEGIDLEAPHDEALLQAALEQAIKAESTLRQQQRAAMDAVASQALANEELQSNRRKVIENGLSVVTCQQKLQEANSDEAAALRQVTALKESLAEAERVLTSMTHTRQMAEQQLKSAQDQEVTLRRCEEAVRLAVAVDCPTDDQIAEAITAVQAAREAMTTGVRVRDALRRKAEADVFEARAAEYRKTAEKLRTAAQRTMDVLSDVVKTISPRITINSSLRLVVTDHARGETYFDDLSAGERWRIAFDLAVEAFARRDERGLVAIPQEAWEGLDEDNRQAVIKAVEGTDLVVFAAQASRDPGATGISVHVLGQKA